MSDAVLDQNYDELKHNLEQFRLYVEENQRRIPADLMKAAKIFFNKIVYGINSVRVNDFSKDKQFYIDKLVEARGILENLNNPLFLAGELNRFHNQINDYLNQNLQIRLRDYKFGYILSSIVILTNIALTIAAAIALAHIFPFLTLILAPAAKTKTLLCFGLGGILVGCIGHTLFGKLEKNTQSRININNQKIIFAQR